MASRRRQGSRQPPRRPPGAGLDPAQYPSLNASFYEAQPHRYFRRRVSTLLLGLNESPEVQAAWAKGVALGRLRAQGWEPFEEGERDGYAAVESLQLLHHCAEALLRLYLAHVDLAPCPWLEVAKLRQFAEFKAQIDDLRKSLEAERALSRLRRVFRGYTDPSDFDTTEAAWGADGEGLLNLIRLASSTVLDEANAYNSAKHGLAIRPTNVSLSFETAEAMPGIDLSNSGPAVTYLETKNRDDGRSSWFETLSFVDASSNIALTQIMTEQIRALWTVAKMRYLRIPASGPIPTVDPVMLTEISTGHWKKPVHLPGLSVGLAYIAED